MSTDMQDVNVAVDPQQQQQQQPHDQYGNPTGQYASQPPAYQPPASGPTGSAAPADAVGCSFASFRRVFFSPTGILRCIEWFCAIVAFGATADVKGYDSFDQFKFVVAMGVLSWIYTMVVLTIDIFDFYSSMPILNIVILGFDCFFGLLDFIAGIVSADKINGVSCSGNSGCDKIKAGAAFIFLCAFTFFGSIFFSFKKWRMSK